jgi:hypothetical protein
MQYNWKSSVFMTNVFCKTEKERLALTPENNFVFPYFLEHDISVHWKYFTVLNSCLSSVCGRNPYLSLLQELLEENQASGVRWADPTLVQLHSHNVVWDSGRGGWYETSSYSKGYPVICLADQ